MTVLVWPLIMICTVICVAWAARRHPIIVASASITIGAIAATQLIEGLT